ncbi:S8 family peptidase [Paenibacillus sp. 481]|uniref:S8 family peptidase n=1 Tax=Paenibacillus sp. 481 TaxID=2835869 RepID=UPI001E52D3AE|nr:S8 family peptidase [Paenibacillus sp. 481]UHA74202.1 S8 family serine peptidase [Paenibacillus sp. 481]
MNKNNWVRLMLAVLFVWVSIPLGIGHAELTKAAEQPPNVQTRIVIKFKDDVNIPYVDGAEQHVAKLPETTANFMTGTLQQLQLKRLFTALEPEAIQQLQQSAEQNIVKSTAGTATSTIPTQPNLLKYFVLEVPQAADTKSLISQISSSPVVETAYIEGKPVQPPSTVDYVNDPHSTAQTYLHTAPYGINAHYAWKYQGGDGTGITIVDLEQGWNVQHEDLVSQNIELISGVNQAYHDHGTAVLGEMVSTDNSIGTVGIVPKATAKVVSQYRTANIYSTADAILSATSVLKAGDILLLEAQTNHPSTGEGLYPVEVESAVFAAIRTASNKGVVVVEAAGNGSNDLDNYKNEQGKHVLNRTSPDFKDSGAIIVGAATSDPPHKRLGFSNYGSRVDTYGFGENVTTTSGSLGQNNKYTHKFSGTSSASPIVAGALASFQGISKARFNNVLSPQQLRNVVTNSQFSTPSADENDKIGRMPNLKALIDWLLPQEKKDR